METDLIPPQTRREAARQTRREAILDVASRSFMDHGYAGTTMTAIATTLGGSKGTLWNYFPSKDLLFAAVLDRKTGAFREQLAIILNPQDDMETALRRFCAQFIDKITSPDAVALHRLVVGETSRFPEIGKIFYARVLERTQSLLAGFLEDAMDHALLRQNDPLVAARQLMGLCMSGFYQQVLIGALDAATPAMIETDIEQAMATFMHGLAA